MRRDFSGKTVVVTGAGGGLGRALCRRFGRAGARIGALDLVADTLDATAGELRRAGVEVATAVCDLTREDAVFAAFAELESRLGPTDVLVNNAGITHLKSFGRGETAAVRRVLEVNFLGAVHATAAAFDALVERRGLVIVITSVAGYAPLVGRTAYCASKHALHGFFDTLRSELRGSGAGVLLVCPSFIATPLRDGYRDEAAIDGRRQTVGADASPDAVAERIFAAAERGRRQISTGLVGRAAYWLHRLSPRLYEWVMLRKIRPE